MKFKDRAAQLVKNRVRHIRGRPTFTILD